ncbi:MAG TPA: hypothetical protein GXZ96_00805 [Firmicutes bacterium]|jgi:hypothetical protein|nr:hypothetical protein [Bacillota bacterium]
MVHSQGNRGESDHILPDHLCHSQDILANPDNSGNRGIPTRANRDNRDNLDKDPAVDMDPVVGMGHAVAPDEVDAWGDDLYDQTSEKPPSHCFYPHLM